MGEVWRAERADDFEQAAAVKLVHPGLGGPLQARFLAERQILAGLDHPAIARLLDGGTASDGRPYLATEFVDGEPITTYADRRRLGINERLALFIDVCEAVAYAHARLIVHRDLKPSNVLVASSTPGGRASGGRESGGDELATAGRVKLLDFGIAKLLDADDALTQTGRPVLTPAYAAPEQTEGGTITTATDVYGLGVLLYELLAGTRPDSGDVTRPSEAVTTAGETAGRLPPDPAGAADDTSSLRSTTADRLRRRLRGDLDRICLKALRRDPERRYRGAAELGADLQRHLDGLPIEARPESVTYRVGKFVRRNRALVAASVLAIVSLVVGLGGALWQAAEADRQRDEADRQRVLASAEADRATETAAFLQSLFRDVDGGAAGADTLRALTLLDRGVERVRVDLADRPVLRGALLHELGATYAELGLHRRGARLVEEAYGIRRDALGEAHPETVESLNRVAHARVFVNGRSAEGAEMLAAVAAARAERFGPDAPLTQSAVADHVEAAARAGLTPAAALPDAPSSAGADPAAEAEALADRLGALIETGDVSGAYALAPDVVRATVAAHGPAHAQVAQALNLSGQAARAAGHLPEAVSDFARAVAVWERLDSQHPDVPAGRIGLGLALKQSGRVDEAEHQYRLALRQLDADAPETHRESATLNLAALLSQRHAFDEAEALYRSVLDRKRAEGGADLPLALVIENNLGRLLLRRGEGGLAAAAYRALRPRAAEVFGLDHPTYAFILNNYAAAAAAGGDPAESERAFREALQRHESALGRDHVRVANPLVGLGRVLVERGRRDEAAAAFRRALRLREAALSPDHWHIAEAQVGLAQALVSQDRQEASRLALSASAALVGAVGDAAQVREQARALLDALASER